MTPHIHWAPATIPSQATCMRGHTLAANQSATAPAAVLIASQQEITTLRNVSEFCHATTMAATNAAIAITTRPIGLASIAALNAHCAAVEAIVAVLWRTIIAVARPQATACIVICVVTRAIFDRNSPAYMRLSCAVSTTSLTFATVIALIAVVTRPATPATPSMSFNHCCIEDMTMTAFHAVNAAAIL